MASVTWEEIKVIKCFKNVSDTKEAYILRGMSVVFGLIATGVALLCNNLGSLISTGGKLFGACMGPMFGFTLVSILLPFANLRGTAFGLITGQLINIWLSMGAAWHGVKTPALELSVKNCTMFPNATIDYSHWNSSTVTGVETHPA